MPCLWSKKYGGFKTRMSLSHIDFAHNQI